MLGIERAQRARSRTIAGVTIALVHLLFNVSGILIIYPIERIRHIPVRLAQGLASLARAIHPELELADFPADPPMCEAA